MTHDDLRTLLDFHYWARDRVLDAAERLTPEQYHGDLKSSFASVRDTLVHIYSAEWNWHERWNGTSPSAMLDPHEYPDVAVLRAAWVDHEAKVRRFVSSLDDASITRSLAYRSLDGRPQSSTFVEMIHHVVNHGTYHRGQVQTMLRQLGAAPARSVDLITFYRERGMGAGKG